MGARTAVHVAGDPVVRGVVALAPWFPPGEPVDALTDRRLVAAHGRRDRITSYAATTAYVERARQVAASARLRDMGPLGHYLIKGARAWDRVATESCLEVLAD
jgi:predicted esterase